MPKNKNPEKQHRGQSSARDRTYSATGRGEKFKPGFPMNLFGNSRMFYIIGLSVMLGGLMLAFLLQSSNPSPSADSSTVDTPTPEETGEPTATATPNPRLFSFADDVVLPDIWDYSATVSTAKGDIVINLFEVEAPGTVNAFVFLVQQGYYDDLDFIRVVENFIAQAGDPNNIRNDGIDGPGFLTPQEPAEIKNTAGTVSMARVAGQLATGGQFFINLKDNPSLDFDSNNAEKDYPFGEIVEGFEVALALVEGDTITGITIDRLLKEGAVEPTATPTVEPTPTPKPEVTFEEPEQVVDADAFTYSATIETSKGTIQVALFADDAPRTVNSFVFLSQKGFFDGIIVQRYVEDFIFQLGDPTGVQGDGYDGPGYTVQEDENDLLNTRGRLSMAKQSGATEFGSQWFINLVDNDSLNAGGPGDAFYPFGEVTAGMGVADELRVGDTIISITITETAK